MRARAGTGYCSPWVRGKYMIWADGELSTGLDRIIYFAKNLQVGLFDNLTYDFGGDPALDSF